MPTRHWIVVAGWIGGVAVALGLVTSAFAAPPACTKQAITEYLGEKKECTVGPLTFQLHGYEGRAHAKRADVTVEPVTDPPGLKFTYPAIKLKASDFVHLQVKAKVKGAVAKTALVGELPTGVAVIGRLTTAGADVNKRQIASLQLEPFVKSFQGTLRQATTAGLIMDYDINLRGDAGGAPLTPIFTVTFTPP